MEQDKTPYIRTLSYEALAEALSISRSKLTKFKADGMPHTVDKTASKRGTILFNADECLIWIDAYNKQEETLEEKEQAEFNKFKLERLKAQVSSAKSKEQMDKLDLEVRKGELVEKKLIIEEWSKYILAARSKLLSIPPACGVDLPTEQRIENQIRQILEQLSKGED